MEATSSSLLLATWAVTVATSPRTIGESSTLTLAARRAEEEKRSKRERKTRGDMEVILRNLQRLANLIHVVALPEELRDQLLLPFARCRVAVAVASLERAALLLADGGQVGTLRFGVDVLSDGARGNVVADAGGGELTPHARAADLLLHARPHVRGG